MSWVMKNWKPLTVVGGLLGISWFAGKKFDEAQAFDAEIYDRQGNLRTVDDNFIEATNDKLQALHRLLEANRKQILATNSQDTKTRLRQERYRIQDAMARLRAFIDDPINHDGGEFMVRLGAETFDAEAVSDLELKKDSCCCGATKKTPCVCMILGRDCSAKKPMCACFRLKAIQQNDEKEAETTMTVEHKDGSKYRYSETDPVYDVRGDIVGHVSEILYETPTYYQSIYDAESFEAQDCGWCGDKIVGGGTREGEKVCSACVVAYDKENNRGSPCVVCGEKTEMGAYSYGKGEWVSICSKDCELDYDDYEAESFEADYDNDEDEHEMVHCSFCNDIIGTEEEVYDEESVEWYNANGETICPPCYKDWMKEYENDMDMRYTPFYADTVAFESFAGRWDVGQTKEIEGVQLTKVSNAYGRGNRRVGAGFIMEYEGHIGEIVANDEAGYRGQKPGFFVLEDGTLRRGGRRTRRGRFNGIAAKDQRECLIRWKHKVGGGTLVIRRPFKKARAVLTTRGFRPYSGVFRPPSSGVSRSNTYIRKSDGRRQAGRPPRQNEAWLGIRYDAETFESESDDRVKDRFFEMAYAIIDMDGEVGIYDEDGGSFITYESWAELEEDMDSGEISLNMMKDFLEERGVIPFWAESKPTLENLKIALKQRNSANCQCDNPNVQSWKVNGKCHVCNEIKKIQAMIDDYDAEEFGAETDSKKVKNTYRLGDREVREYADGSLEVVMDAESVSFKSFWIVAKKGSKLFPAGQVGELRVYDNGERTIVLDNNIVIPFYTQATAYAYLNKHFMVYPKRGKADMSLVMDAEGDHDHDHDDHDHEDIDELVEKIDRLTDFAITFIHDGGFGGEPQGFIVDEDLGLKTEIVKYVEGSMDLRMVRDLETNELVSVRFALSGDPDSTPILYLPLPEKIATVPQEERAIKRS